MTPAIYPVATTQPRRDDIVLAVVDLQERLTPTIQGVEKIVAACRLVIRTFDAFDLPVLFTEQYPRGLGRTIEPISQLFAGRTPLEKTEFGCFANTDFEQAVLQTRRKTLALCGVESHICVCQTALQAVRSGYTVHVVTDAIGAHTVEAHLAGLDRMRMGGVVLTYSEMLVYELLERAATPEFRRNLAILKEENSA